MPMFNNVQDLSEMQCMFLTRYRSRKIVENLLPTGWLSTPSS